MTPGRTSSAGGLIESLTRAFGNGPTGKPWVPSDPTDLFREHERSLENLYRRLPRAVRRRTETEQQVWLDMLRVSGVAPDEDNADRLFVTHSLLIAIARLVAHGLTQDRDGWMSTLVSWTAASEGTRKWALQLHETVEKHDWKRRRRDVMQALYMGLVPARDRKGYGEYYTPDWLASLIVDEALDEDWCSRAIGRAAAGADGGTPLEGIGVLDPTCGSGTFLYHAARRILEAPQMRQRGASERADITARLVHGIDVHPVAVEVARTNMLRALPAAPTGGGAAIRIRMGDALLAENQSTSLFDVRGSMRILAPKGRHMSLPMTFVRRPSFADDMKQVVEAAGRDKPIAPAVLKGLDGREREDVELARNELAGTIGENGNAIWTWYAVNLAGPHLLAEQKVDRIVANPPWVKLSEIQDAARKRAMEQCGLTLGIHQGGKQAAHTDIAAFFIRRARELYLDDPRTNPAIWLVKKSSLRGGHWEAFRELHHETLAQSVDLEDLQPFGGGDAQRSCLLFDHRPMAGTQDRELTGTRAPGTAPEQGKARRPNPADAPRAARRLIRFAGVRAGPPQAPSGYMNEKHEPVFRQGATIVPHVLTMAAETAPGTVGYRVRVTTRRSSHPPWSSLEPCIVEVPRQWMTTVLSSTTVPRFAARMITEAIIPMNSQGELVKENEIRESSWRLLDELYKARAPRGRSTPASLMSNLDHLGKLRGQTAPAGDGRAVDGAAPRVG